MYVRADNLGQFNQVGYRDRWETFDLIYNGDGTFSLKTYHNTYLSFTHAGKHSDIVQVYYIGPYEKLYFQY